MKLICPPVLLSIHLSQWQTTGGRSHISIAIWLYRASLELGFKKVTAWMCWSMNSIHVKWSILVFISFWIEVPPTPAVRRTYRSFVNEAPGAWQEREEESERWNELLRISLHVLQVMSPAQRLCHQHMGPQPAAWGTRGCHGLVPRWGVLVPCP